MKYLLIKNDNNQTSDKTGEAFAFGLLIAGVVIYFLYESIFVSHDYIRSGYLSAFLIIGIAFMVYNAKRQLIYEYIFIFNENKHEVLFKQFEKNKASIAELLANSESDNLLEFQKLNILEIINIHVYEYRVNGSLSEKELRFIYKKEKKEERLSIDLRKHPYFNNQINILITTILKYNPSIQIGV